MAWWQRTGLGPAQPGGLSFEPEEPERWRVWQELKAQSSVLNGRSLWAAGHTTLEP